MNEESAETREAEKNIKSAKKSSIWFFIGLLFTIAISKTVLLALSLDSFITKLSKSQLLSCRWTEHFPVGINMMFVPAFLT